ncbi:MAG TPA: Uma2 family endonuclease [Euzebyales bacterium]|nr:Uma2 family endonuclease [Euzebyales bacterium]
MDLAADVVTRPLRRVEYDALIAQGFLVGEPIELVEGHLVIMSPQGDRHSLIIMWLNRRVVEAIPVEEGDVGVQVPLAANDLSEPEPDLYVVPPGTTSGPGLPTTASLVIEVANSSRGYDLGVKAALYARVGIPDYWVVDIPEERVVVHREPTARGFASVTPVGRGVVAALRHPRLRLDVADMLRPGT